LPPLKRRAARLSYSCGVAPGGPAEAVLPWAGPPPEALPRRCFWGPGWRPRKSRPVFRTVVVLRPDALPRQCCWGPGCRPLSSCGGAPGCAAVAVLLGAGLPPLEKRGPSARPVVMLRPDALPRQCFWRTPAARPVVVLRPDARPVFRTAMVLRPEALPRQCFSGPDTASRKARPVFRPVVVLRPDALPWRVLLGGRRHGPFSSSFGVVG
jgi:hypothetical protein